MKKACLFARKLIVFLLVFLFGCSIETPGSTSLQSENASAQLTCHITLDCSSVFDHTDWIDPAKLEILPEDGILYSSTASFSEGETVFDVLQRITRQQGIHMDFQDNAIGNNKYIRAIGNLYEKDCGSQSGWKYFINDTYYPVSSSQYILKGGETIRWVYTTE